MDTTRPIMVHQYLFRFWLSSVQSLVATQGRGLFVVIRDRGTGQTTLRMEVDYLYAEVYGYRNIPGGQSTAMTSVAKAVSGSTE